MADFSIAPSILSSPLSGRAGGLPGGRNRPCRATWLAIAGGGEGPAWVHPLIKRLVNRTPPITSAVQIRSVALRLTQCLHPSRKDCIRPRALFVDTPPSL